MIKKIMFYMISFLLLFILFFLLVFHFTNTNFQHIAKIILQGGAQALLLVVFAMILQLVLQAFSWQILLKGNGYNASIFTMHKAIFVGWAANFITPSMYLGGEPLRAYILQKECKISFRIALSSVLVHKFIEFSTFIIFILISTILVFMRYRDVLGAKIQAAVITSVMTMSFFFFSVLIAIISKKQIFRFLTKICIKMKIFPKFFTKNLPKIEEMEDFIIASFYKSTFYTLFSFFIMIGFDLLIFFRPALFFIFIGRPMDFGELALIFLMIQLVQALQITPGGVGILEGGIVGTLAVLKIKAAPAITFATYCRLGDFVIVSIGLSLAFFMGLSRTIFSNTQPIK